MSKNNTIRKSDKKFIRREKARIRAQFFDFKKQEEKINELYSRFLPKIVAPKPAVVEKPKDKKEEPRKEIKASKVTKTKEKKDEKKHNKA